MLNLAVAIFITGQNADSQIVPLLSGLATTVRGNRRSPVRTDPVESLLVEGTWSAPREGDVIGDSQWSSITAAADGSFSGPATRGGYLYFQVQSSSEKMMWLSEAGATVAYVNGEPRVGDPYSFGYVSLPIKLRRGSNELLFATGRGGFSGSLVPIEKHLSFTTQDMTLPDRVGNERGSLVAGIIVRNATSDDESGLTYEAISETGRSSRGKITRIPALGIRKVAIELPSGSDSKFKLTLKRGTKIFDSMPITIRKRSARESHRRTFISEIDGSVQYYAVQPSLDSRSGQALVLSLHGASVEAQGQAEAYSQKDWAHIVAPTNRRPFGFDWEEVGRRDAIEVLALARKQYKTDPLKTHLTGHSMGGHGTWQIGAHYPGEFASIGPSAGWISFFTYGGGMAFSDPDGIEKMLLRANNGSQTLLLKSNFWNQSVYVLHGDADDNVPVSQARTMIKELAGHPNIKFHEQAGAGHWWDASDAPGADCVDWKPMFEGFSSTKLLSSKARTSIDFTTVSPTISSKMGWASIVQQTVQLVPSRIKLSYERESQRISGWVENVAALQLHRGELPGPVRTVGLNGIEYVIRSGSRDIWVLTSHPGESSGSLPRGSKTAARGGVFKEILNRRFVLVFGTKGTDAENAWARNKARFDAETFWYRGNGSVEVIPDRDFLSKMYPDRNVILYGNETTNSAYAQLVSRNDLEFSSTGARIGDRKLPISGTAFAVILPRRDSIAASIGLIGGSDIVGMRLCDRMPLFTSGAAFPDVLITSSKILVEGSKGILAAGFFGNDWSVAQGDFVFRH